MDRKKFFKKGLFGFGTIIALPTTISTFSESEKKVNQPEENCIQSPRETTGPFPIKSPADLVKENIVGDRSGIALLINLKITDNSRNCEPVAGVFVDIWHCDAVGYYSEYGGTRMQQTNLTNQHFLRGRQTTDKNGLVSFISIFPGWYRGRAPHIHVDILNANEKSLLVTQIAFPKEVCDTVYATNDYKGVADTLNERDNVFSDSLDQNMSDSISGDIVNGYTLSKTIVI